MNLSYDAIIVGGGLAGACAALHLSRTRSVLLLERDVPASGASGVAAGLVNPIMSQRAKPVWRMHEALDALQESLDLAGATSLFRKTGVIRPAADEEQAEIFRQAAKRMPDEADWLPHTYLADTFPDVRAPFGALRVRNAGTVPVPELVRALLDAAVRNGAEVALHADVRAWNENGQAASVDVVRTGKTERFHARHVILALGDAWSRYPDLAGLRLHRVKGQSVSVAPPTGLDPARVPILAGMGYVVPEADSFIVGSSYEHVFTSLEPDPDQTRRILDKAAAMLPRLSEATVIEETAGVRVNVPGTRLPMLGPLPGHARVWIFTGLGSKGLLMAPLLGRELPSFLGATEQIPSEIRVRTRKNGN